VSSDAYSKDPDLIDGALAESPVGLVPTSGRIRKERHGAINSTLRAVIRAEWESGESATQLARRHGVTSRTIQRWISKHEWERSAEDAPSAILQHARREIKRKVEDAKIEATAAVESVLASHKGSSETLKSMLSEAMGRALAYPNQDPFRQMLIIKVATEIAKNIQAIDRKTWGLDHTKTTTTTAIFDVLSSMEDNVSVESQRIDKRYSE
tara:strand:+ start:4127 stop:4756 length:630 start_codon:yes stop_codon:yes gene_type:complete